MRARDLSPPSPTVLALEVASVVALASLAHCAAAPPPPDLLYGPAYGGSDPLAAEPPPARTSTTTTTGAVVPPSEVAAVNRVLSTSSTPTLATDGVNVYFGDEHQNALMRVPGAGGDNPSVLGRPGPVDIALDGQVVTWIARPGDVVLRVGRSGAPADTLRDQGVFTSLTASRGQVFVTEKIGSGGALTLLAGGSATPLATFDRTPRAVEVDQSFAYVVTARDIVRVPRNGDNTKKLLASGRELAHAAIDRDSVYVTAEVATGVRALVRVSKAGGALVDLAHPLRNAPFALYGGQLYFVVDGAPELRRVPVKGGSSTLVARDDAYENVTALVADELRIYVATEKTGLTALARAR